MKTFPTEAFAADEAPPPPGRKLGSAAGDSSATEREEPERGTLLLFADGEGGTVERLVVEGGPERTVLAVPGEAVAIHWLDLSEELSRPQASAAARLLLADAVAEPIETMHVAAGRPEQGLTPVALVPSERMGAWLAAAAAAGHDPDSIVPTPLLIPAPAEGLVRRDRGNVADFRGPAAAFAIEPELAGPLVGARSVAQVDEAVFAAGLAEALSPPLLDLRQGPFARRRGWRLERARLRRILLLAAALALLTLAIQIAAILRYTFAADAAEAEAQALAAEARTGGHGFGATAGALFEAVRETPNVELSRLSWRPDGSLAAAVAFDSEATLAALVQRLEASGLAVEAGAPRSGGGRPVADLTVRP